MTGSARKATFVGSEAGILTGRELVVANARVTLSTGASGEMAVKDTLRVSLSSGADFVYPEVGVSLVKVLNHLSLRCFIHYTQAADNISNQSCFLIFR